jgi:hypothetical protein
MADAWVQRAQVWVNETYGKRIGMTVLGMSAPRHD